MSSADDMKAIKNRVSAALLKLPGVAGVGLPARGLTVYLENESFDVRAGVASALKKLDLPVDVHWEITGKFGKF